MDILNLLVSIVILIILELVLGIDNLVFLTILTEKLPQSQRKQARRVGLLLAMVTRLLFLLSAVFLVGLTEPLLHISTQSFSVRSLFMLFGGLFLLYKSTEAIHADLDVQQPIKRAPKEPKYASFFAIVSQIALMDIIFSFDSVLTAIGLTTQFWVMALAIIIAIVMMIYASEPVAVLVEKYPSIKMLALSFLIMIGMMLIADGFMYHIPRGYIYFAMGFSLFVEILNLLKDSRVSKLRK